MNKVPKGKKVYRGGKCYKEGQECPFLKADAQANNDKLAQKPKEKEKKG